MTEPELPAVTKDSILRTTVQIAVAFLGKNPVAAEQIPDVLSSVYGALARLRDQGGEAKPEALRPAVPIKRSVQPDYLVCLEDGKKLKMLKRHLRTTFGLSPDEYRAKWGLPADYPMVAPNYASQRSDFAKKIGLGRRPGQAPKRRGGRTAQK